MTRIMLNAVHATGKSTTAIAVADRLGSLFYVPSFASRVAKEKGFDLNKHFTPEQLMAYQTALIDAFVMSYEMTAQMNTIYDRSPLDFACYLLSSHEGVDPQFQRDYIQRCFDLTEEYCDVLIYPKSDLSITYESKDNRPNCSKEEQAKRVVYDERLELFINALDTSKVKVITVPVEFQYSDRVNYITQELRKIL